MRVFLASWLVGRGDMLIFATSAFCVSELESLALNPKPKLGPLGLIGFRVA